MTDEDLLAEYTDDEIERLTSAKRNAQLRVRDLQNQLDRAYSDLFGIEGRINCWLNELRADLAHTCGRQPFCILRAGHSGPCPAPVFERISP